MSYFKKFFGHLKTTMTHKWWVFYYALHLGYPLRGLFHDMSKFSPVEFFEGVKYWDGKRSPVLAAKEDIGISYAWLHHRGRNKHHYEYWIDKLDDGGVPYKIPFKYVVEMVCDWFAAYRAYGHGKDYIFQKEYEWWEEKSKTAKIHESTKKLITSLFWNLCAYDMCYGSEKKALREFRKFLPGLKRSYEKETNLLNLSAR